jgi:predicted dehydrogenase
MAPIRIGILGAARIAPPAIIAPARDNPEVAVVALGARDPSRAMEFAKTHDIPHVAASYADLVARDDVDLVYNALPASLHAQWSIAALEHGKAVLCEKPFAMGALEARAMVEASSRAQKPLIEAFHYRHHQVLKRAFAIARDELGPLTKAEAVFDVGIPFVEGELRWTAGLGGGALMDLGCYCVHALRTAIGAEPTVERATATVERGVDATTSATLRFPGGLRAALHCSMAPGSRTSLLRIEGEKGSLEIQNFIAPQMGCRFTVHSGGLARTEPVEGPSTFAAQLAHVCDVLLRGAQPLAGGQDAIANMTAIDRIYEAAGVRRPPA